MNKLWFNYGQADITPEEPVLLAGYANRRGPSKEIHRRLTTRCVVVKLTDHYYSRTVCVHLWKLIEKRSFNLTRTA